MSGRWFRVYAGLVDDPKWIKLGPDLKVALITIWCIAAGNGGRLLPLDDMAIKFRLPEQKTKKLLDELRHCGFIDDDETGYAPHNWNGRQFQSDVSTERVKRFRQQQRNVSPTVSETPPYTEQNRTEQSRAEQKDVCVLSSSGDSLELKESKMERSSGRKRPKTSLPQDFLPDLSIAQDLGWTEEKAIQEAFRFKDSARQHDRKYADWQAAWRNWCRSPFQQQNQQGKTNGLHGKRAGSVLDAIDRLPSFGEGGSDQEAGENPILGLPPR